MIKLEKKLIPILKINVEKIVEIFEKNVLINPMLSNCSI